MSEPREALRDGIDELVRVLGSRCAGGVDSDGEPGDVDRREAVDGCCVVVRCRLVDECREVAERGATVLSAADGLPTAEEDAGATGGQSEPWQDALCAVIEGRTGAAAPVEMIGPRAAPSPASPPDTKTRALLVGTS